MRNLTDEKHFFFVFCKLLVFFEKLRRQALSLGLSLSLNYLIIYLLIIDLYFFSFSNDFVIKILNWVTP